MFEFILNIVTQGGVFGVFVLMALENLFPPIPSEVIMPLAGFAAAQGKLSITGVIIAGTAGSVLGALPWYYAGRLYGIDRMRDMASRHGRWMTVGPEDVDKAMRTFQRHGKAAVFFGRLVPAIRTLISVPAGIARMPMFAFLVYSTIGSLVWTGFLASAGFLLKAQYAVVAEYLDPGSKIILGLILAAYLYRLFTHRARPTA